MVAYVALVLFFLLEYIRPTSYIPALIPLHLNMIVPLIAVAASTFSRDAKAAAKGADFNLALLAAMIALMVVSRFTAFMGPPAQALLESVVGYAAIAWVITRAVDSERRLKGIFGVLVLVHVVIMFLSPAMLIDPSSRTHTITSGSFLGDGNDFALSLVIALPLCLFLIVKSPSLLKRVLLVAGLGALLLGIIASQSRGATLALGVVGLYYWFKSGRSVAMAAIVGTALIGVMALAPDSYFSRMNTIANPTDGSAQGRINSWKLAWSEAMNNPLLGVGAGNTPYMARQNPHSIYFMALGELGFPGLFVLLGLIVGNLSANRRLLKQCHGPDRAAQRQLLAALSASMIAFATAGAFLSATYYPHAYILSGLLAAGRRVVRDWAPAATAATPAAVPQEITYHWALAPGPRRIQ
ncbi:MAG TPA: O-antigen ligase family protein [Vicinamibacterales bacterium]|jgi:probable O-glycosylation ligase (exosortase A-associated)|nr:O-antigen ligase family protein [Vicinamibacterales bacterium]